jgi:hypothetical protein
MSHEFYEVWAVDLDGNEELIDTANSKTHAVVIANSVLVNSKYAEVIVYKETEDGELVEITQLQQ